MSNNKQQTAVEWYIIQRDEIEMKIRLMLICANQYEQELTKADEQAKAMHKEEVTKAWQKGDGQFDKVADKMSLEYYNETYGGGEQ